MTELALLEEQSKASVKVMASTKSEARLMFFLSIPDGIRKTFLIKLLLANIRKEGILLFLWVPQVSLRLHWIEAKLLTPPSSYPST